MLHLGSGLDDVEKCRRCEVADRRHEGRQSHRRQKRLVDDAVDLLRLIRAGKARHQHGHAGEQRSDEDNDDDDDLPTDADRSVAGVADEVTDHHVVDDPLQTGDDVLQHRRPGKTPYRTTDRSVDNRPVELLSIFLQCSRYFRKGMSTRNRSSRRKSAAHSSTPIMTGNQNGWPTRTWVAVAPPR